MVGLSAFGLTEMNVGSDPANLQTEAVQNEDGTLDIEW